MISPHWSDPSRGTRIRAALWLRDVIGVGNSFSKAELRSAFPGVEQIDRRLRDLREDGWIIDTHREDVSLEIDRLRFVAIGGSVWEVGYKRPSTERLSAKMRSAVFAADGYACVICGVMGGDFYPDDKLRAAQLCCQRLGAKSRGARWRTVCDRCLRGGAEEETAPQIIAAASGLDRTELKEICEWVARGERSARQADRLWSRISRLPSDERAEVRLAIIKMFES